jgi:hypothetical protein
MQRAESSSRGAQATRPTAGSVRWTDALGNEEGESGLPQAAQPATRRTRCARSALTGATSNLNLSGALAVPVGQPRRTIVTWLILPVVICLSQRLSHACLSISNYTAKLRMAHYISYRLFDSTLLLG